MFRKTRILIFALTICGWVFSGCDSFLETPSNRETGRETTENSTPIPSFSDSTVSATKPSNPPTAIAALSTPSPQNPTPGETLIPPPASHPNIILIVVDSLRADHLSSYGYHRNTTPNLDNLVARGGARFTQAISPASWTCPANASLFTGLNPVSLGDPWHNMRKSLPRSEKTLAEYLRKNGYYTAGFINNSCLASRNGFAQGFDVYDENTLDQENVDSSNKVRADEMNNRVLDWLRNTWLKPKSKNSRLFLFIYYMEPHVWYDPPAPFDVLYDDDYDGVFSPAYFAIGQGVVSGEQIPNARDVEHILALYDGEIAYWDSQIGILLSELDKLNMLENTLLVITSDHGELFGEHGKWVHGSSLYDGVIHVPLLMSYEGQIIPNIQIHSPVQSMDLMPTILGFAGLQVPEQLDAISLRAYLQGAVPDESRPVFSNLNSVTDPKHWAYWVAPRYDLRAVQLNGWKLIHAPENDTLNELYQLQAKFPYEDQNVVLGETERFWEMLGLIQDYYKE